MSLLVLNWLSSKGDDYWPFFSTFGHYVKFVEEKYTQVQHHLHNMKTISIKHHMVTTANLIKRLKKLDSKLKIKLPTG